MNACERVIRRVGGLEVLNAAVEKGIEVIRRVGGLEVLLVTEQTIALVIRRVGGLEDYGTMGL